MSEALGDIGWWTRLRDYQCERIDSLDAVISDPECGIHPSGAGIIHEWLSRARDEWYAVNVPEGERLIRKATEKLAWEREHRANIERELERRGKDEPR